MFHTPELLLCSNFFTANHSGGLTYGEIGEDPVRTKDNFSVMWPVEDNTAHRRFFLGNTCKAGRGGSIGKLLPGGRVIER
jgi:hypothetical protein